MYLWICSAEEHSKHQMMEGTSVTSSASAPCVPLFCSHHILTPSMIIGTLLFGFTNIKHRQELFFWLGGLRWDSLCTKWFHFCRWKRAWLSKTKILQKDRKTLIYLNSHRYYVIYYLYFLNTSKLKWNPCHTYSCLLHSCCLVLSHNALYFSFERELFMWQDQITVAKETTLTAVPPTERKSKLFVNS